MCTHKKKFKVKIEQTKIFMIAAYNRHVDEFSEEDSTVVKLTTVDGKQREVRIFSETD